MCAVHITYGRPNDKTAGRHLLRKRSLSLSAPVNSLVEDVSEATTFRDRASKLRQLSQTGEMYPEHNSPTVLARRKANPKKVSDADDSDDDSDITDKKFKIRKDDDDAADDDKNSSDDSSDNDSTDDESGSGDEEDDNATTSDDNKDSADSDDKEETPGATSKKQCRKRCKTPLTFHQCAFPRCSQKLGTIKDLCFFLCKHQKTKCERVCD